MSFLGWFVEPVVPVKDIFIPPYSALVSPVQNSFFLAHTRFNFLSPIRPASWAGIRAGSPVS
jgi:hypothetical protein